MPLAQKRCTLGPLLLQNTVRKPHAESLQVNPLQRGLHGSRVTRSGAYCFADKGAIPRLTTYFTTAHPGDTPARDKHRFLFSSCVLQHEVTE